MDKLEITTKLLLEVIKKNGIKKPSGKGEEFNENSARTIAKMFKIIYEVVDSCDDNEEQSSDKSAAEVYSRVKELMNQIDKKGQ